MAKKGKENQSRLASGQPGKHSEKMKKEVAEKHIREGASKKALAKEVGVYPSTVRKWIRRYGKEIESVSSGMKRGRPSSSNIRKQPGGLPLLERKQLGQSKLPPGRKHMNGTLPHNDSSSREQLLQRTLSKAKSLVKGTTITEKSLPSSTEKGKRKRTRDSTEKQGNGHLSPVSTAKKNLKGCEQSSPKSIPAKQVKQNGHFSPAEGKEFGKIKMTANKHGKKQIKKECANLGVENSVLNEDLATIEAIAINNDVDFLRKVNGTPSNASNQCHGKRNTSPNCSKRKSSRLSSSLEELKQDLLPKRRKLQQTNALNSSTRNESAKSLRESKTIHKNGLIEKADSSLISSDPSSRQDASLQNGNSSPEKSSSNKQKARCKHCKKFAQLDCVHDCCFKHCMETGAPCPGHEARRRKHEEAEELLKPREKKPKMVLAKGSFSEDAFKDFEETVTIWCLRDFLRDPKHSRDSLESQTRALRFLQRVGGSETFKVPPTPQDQRGIRAKKFWKKVYPRLKQSLERSELETASATEK